MTRHVPIKKKPPGDKSFKTKQENTEDTIIEIEVAKPLRMLSAYLTVIATTSPPKACNENSNCLGLKYFNFHCLPPRIY